ncbi:unnamed protein product [Ixodes pacificus]
MPCFQLGGMHHHYFIGKFVVYLSVLMEGKLSSIVHRAWKISLV